MLGWMGWVTAISDRPTTIAPLKAVLIILTVPQNSSCGPKVISYIRESDIRGALGPIHCIITLKACAMALGDGTKCKTCFGCPCPRMVLFGP